ncbi:MAG: cysteine synthase A [Candidatus Caldarchaeum sp.]|nr:cysteine synthase A [Candidatus Caldarchaeum sp.]MCS7137519.1 cysteine synthase A [Candidatus Caldarchaeum sp.]MDW7977325.1 cysteine synthase A [Candidatus Caldarchaeum sp.]MDW8359940.1 cysteine synthase A [Candidatus Caldarchaeum sp.]
MKVFDDVLDVIGGTPLLKLSKIPRQEGVDAEIYAKLEFYNPTGSLKDRIYREMITKAVERGELRPGMEILEVSTGNAGIACSFVGTHLGYKVTIVMPEGMSEERKQLIKAFGGDIVFTPGAESDVDLSLRKAESMIASNPGKYWFPNQFTNPDNVQAHIKTTGPEIWEQTQGRIDCFVMSQGSGGTVTGVGRYLKSRNSTVKVYTAEPSEAAVIADGVWGSHKIEGIGDGFIPRNLDLGVLDGVVTVSSAESIDMTRKLARLEGVFCGISSGCNVVAALKVAKKNPKLKRIVTVICDSGNRYLSTEAFGPGKKTAIPEREHTLDQYTVDTRIKHLAKLDIIR